MIRKAYVVVTNLPEGPKIFKVDITESNGVSWREAKKALRSYYLAKAAEVRALREKDLENEKTD
jgi:hypothetical protein